MGLLPQVVEQKRKSRRVRITSAIGAAFTTTWAVVTTIIDVANLPSDASDAWKAMVSAPEFLPFGLAILFVSALIWSFWPINRLEPVAAATLHPSPELRPRRQGGYQLTEENLAGLERVADGMNARSADFGTNVHGRIEEQEGEVGAYEAVLERQRLVVRAKAQLMTDRLSSRNWSMMEPGRSARHDSYLAAMWDAEERGHFLDETHRSTFMPMGKGAPRDLPGDTIAELQRNVIEYKEKRRQADLEYETKRRRELIKTGRDLAFGYCHGDQGDTFREYLEGQRGYADIRPHLSDDYKRKLEARRTAYVDPDGAKYPTLVKWFLDELDRLEKEWRLI